MRMRMDHHRLAQNDLSLSKKNLMCFAVALVATSWTIPVTLPQCVNGFSPPQQHKYSFRVAYTEEKSESAPWYNRQRQQSSQSRKSNDPSYQEGTATDTEEINNRQNLYELLGPDMSPSSSHDELKFRYNQLITNYELDDDEKVAISNAWETLSDSDQRNRYDCYLQAKEFTNKAQRWMPTFDLDGAAPAVGSIIETWKWLSSPSENYKNKKTTTSSSATMRHPELKDICIEDVLNEIDDALQVADGALEMINECYEHSGSVTASIPRKTKEVEDRLNSESTDPDTMGDDDLVVATQSPSPVEAREKSMTPTEKMYLRFVDNDEMKDVTSEEESLPTMLDWEYSADLMDEMIDIASEEVDSLSTVPYDDSAKEGEDKIELSPEENSLLIMVDGDPTRTMDDIIVVGSDEDSFPTTVDCDRNTTNIKDVDSEEKARPSPDETAIANSNNTARDTVGSEIIFQDSLLVGRGKMKATNTMQEAAEAIVQKLRKDRLQEFQDNGNTIKCESAVMAVSKLSREQRELLESMEDDIEEAERNIQRGVTALEEQVKQITKARSILEAAKNMLIKSELDLLVCQDIVKEKADELDSCLELAKQKSKDLDNLLSSKKNQVATACAETNNHDKKHDGDIDMAASGADDDHKEDTEIATPELSTDDTDSKWQSKKKGQNLTILAVSEDTDKNIETTEPDAMEEIFVETPAETLPSIFSGDSRDVIGSSSYRNVVYENLIEIHKRGMDEIVDLDPIEKNVIAYAPVNKPQAEGKLRKPTADVAVVSSRDDKTQKNEELRVDGDHSGKAKVEARSKNPSSEHEMNQEVPPKPKKTKSSYVAAVMDAWKRAQEMQVEKTTVEMESKKVKHKVVEMATTSKRRPKRDFYDEMLKGCKVVGEYKEEEPDIKRTKEKTVYYRPTTTADRDAGGNRPVPRTAASRKAAAERRARSAAVDAEVLERRPLVAESFEDFMHSGYSRHEEEQYVRRATKRNYSYGRYDGPNMETDYHVDISGLYNNHGDRLRNTTPSGRTMKSPRVEVKCQLMDHNWFEARRRQLPIPGFYSR